MNSVYYFDNPSGMLIRVEHKIHMIKTDDSDIYQHYDIVKNVVNINNQAVNFVYTPPPPAEDPGLTFDNWVTIGICLGAAAVIVVLVQLWKRAIRSEQEKKGSQPMPKE